jgi:hypothetical protein
VTCRQEVLDAIELLDAETRHCDFSSGESLEAAGWTVLVRWGREPGIDSEATRGDARLVLDAKGETTPGPQQVRHSPGAIGELVQRVSGPVRATT